MLKKLLSPDGSFFSLAQDVQFTEKRGYNPKATHCVAFGLQAHGEFIQKR